MLHWIRYVSARRAAMTLGINALKRVGISRRDRACNVHLDDGIEFAAKAAIDGYESVRPHLPDLTGLTGLEIGPGNNMATAECFLANGAEAILCAEQFATVQFSPELSSRIAQKYGAYAASPQLICEPFEKLEQPVDFIYSIDVLEHVRDVPMAMENVARLLKPGGVAVHSVDFAGHNAYQYTGIDFLTCPEWFWRLLHSNLETTNRIRLGELKSAALNAGLEVVKVIPSETVSEERVEKLRSDMHPRFQAMAAEDLRILQAVVVFRKPGLV